MAWVLGFDGVDHVSHVLESPVGVILHVVLSLQFGGQGSAVYVVGGDDRDGRVLSRDGHRQHQGSPYFDPHR